MFNVKIIRIIFIRQIYMLKIIHNILKLLTSLVDSTFISPCQVTRDDLNRIGRQMLDSKAAVAAIGSLKKMPSFSDIEIGLLDKEVTSCLTLDVHIIMPFPSSTPLHVIVITPSFNHHYIVIGRPAQQKEVQPVQMILRLCSKQCNPRTLVSDQSTNKQDLL